MFRSDFCRACFHKVEREAGATTDDVKRYRLYVVAHLLHELLEMGVLRERPNSGPESRAAK